MTDVAPAPLSLPLTNEVKQIEEKLRTTTDKKARKDLEKRRKFLLNHPDYYVEQQKYWIEEHGGDLEGYIKRYGKPGDADCYGAGGAAIYEADFNGLKRREEYADKMRDKYNRRW